MAPVAAAVEITVFGSMLLAVMVGAACGALLWKLRVGLVLSFVAAAAVFVLAIIADSGFFWLRISVTFGAAPLAQALLVARFAARELEARAKLRALWASIAAFILSLVTGAFCLLLPARLEFWGASWIALGVVGCLVVWSLATRRSISL